MLPLTVGVEWMSANDDRNKETSLWNWLKDHIKELKPLRSDIQRIENTVAKGTPDVEGCIDGESFWCELKVAYPMAGDKFRTKITVEQVRRALKRHSVGGRSWILIRTCGPTWRDNRHYLIRGCDAEELLEPTQRARLEELSVAHPASAAVELLKTMVGPK